eukprot:4072900-Ditylum_brightwellii.AAC.1
MVPLVKNAVKDLDAAEFDLDDIIQRIKFVMVRNNSEINCIVVVSSTSFGEEEEEEDCDKIEA